MLVVGHWALGIGHWEVWEDGEEIFPPTLPSPQSLVPSHQSPLV
ncbi:hypothetical protein [Nostoc paludosum]|nr:hypothetical protein [Nostoc paludosum]